MIITELPNKRRGRPLLLGKELDDYMILYIKHLRASGAVANTAQQPLEWSSFATVILSLNGGPISITKVTAVQDEFCEKMCNH